MIKLINIGEFNDGITCPIDRIYKTVALRLDPTKFRVIAMSNHSDFPEHIQIIDTQRGKINKIKSYLKISFTEADIIHTRGWPESIIITKLWRMKNPQGKVVFTLYGMPELKNKLRYAVARRLAHTADVVTAVSGTTKKEAKDAFGVDCKVIYDGVDTKILHPQEHDNERAKILYVGTLVARKNPQYVVKLAREFPECDFIIHGRGAFESMLEKESKDLENIVLDTSIIPYEELGKLYAKFDIFLFPSIHEGFANVVLEAAASGLPIVCFNATSLPEFVEHGKNGMLANDYNEMKDNLQYLIEDETERKKMSRNAREKALEFDWDIIARQYADLYENIVEEV